MILPRKHSNWTEFAKECIHFEKENAETKTVQIHETERTDEGDPVRDHIFEYDINAVKAKAFDEIISQKVELSEEEIELLKVSLYNSTAAYIDNIRKEIHNIFNLLYLLKKT